MSCHRRYIALETMGMGCEHRPEDFLLTLVQLQNPTLNRGGWEQGNPYQRTGQVVLIEAGKKAFSNTFSAARALAAVLAGGCAPFAVVSIVVAVAGASACAFSADAACVAFMVGMAATLASASGLSFRSSTNTLATHVVARRGFRRVRASGFTGTPEDGRA